MEDIRIKRWITYKGKRLPIGEDGKILKISKDDIENMKKKKHRLTNENIQQIIDESISEWDEDYARLYLTKINPKDFLKLTSSEDYFVAIKNNTLELDLEKIEESKYVADMMYLDIDLETGKVRGHEGRHRMSALENEGYELVDIVVFPYNYDKYHAKEIDNIVLKPQEGTDRYENVTIKKLTPVSKRNVEMIKNREY